MLDWPLTARQRKLGVRIMAKQRLAKVYSYLRFSDKKQGEGDSVNRQTGGAASWAQKAGLELDRRLMMTDSGESAFRGDHRADPDRTALADFLDRVKRGEIERGSYLVIESLDRLTRESIRPALTLLLNLIEAGIKVVQLQPREMIYDEDADAFTLLIAIMELTRGHAESAVKSFRVAQAWDDARAEARKGVVMFGRLPAWIRRTDAGTLELIPERAAALRELMRLGAEGQPVRKIMRKLEDSDHKPFGEGAEINEKLKRQSLSQKWQRGYVEKLLHDRRLIGECQPKLTGGIPVGPPIPGYFPAVIGPDEFTRVAAVLANKPKPTGFTPRDRKYINIFSGMLRDETGSPMCLKANRAVMNFVSLDGVEGRCPLVSFPCLILERGLLAVIREVHRRDVVGDDGGDGGDKATEMLRNQRDAAAAEVMAIYAQCEEEATPMLAALLKNKERKLADIKAALEDAQRRESAPSAVAWQSCETLSELLANAPDPDDVRVKLRTALRRVLVGATMLIVVRGRERLCFVQMRFRDPAVTRFALIVYRQGTNGRQSEGWVESRADIATGFDLAKGEHAEAMRDELQRVDMLALIARLSDSTFCDAR